MDEKEGLPQDDQVPYLRVYGAKGQPVRLWKYDGLVRSLFSQTDETILSGLRYGDFVQYPPGES
jgi:hypothetical protein